MLGRAKESIKDCVARGRAARNVKAGPSFISRIARRRRRDEFFVHRGRGSLSRLKGMLLDADFFFLASAGCKPIGVLLRYCRGRAFFSYFLSLRNEVFSHCELRVIFSNGAV